MDELRDQQLRNLTRANEIRKARKRLKRRLARMEPARAMAKAVHEVYKPHEALHSMAAEDFLVMLPQIGRVRARQLLRQAQVGTQDAIGDLAPETRTAVMRSLDNLARQRYGEEAVRA